MRDVGCRNCKITTDGLILGYKIAGNLAREKALDIMDYQYYRTSEAWPLLDSILYLPGSFLM